MDFIDIGQELDAIRARGAAVGSNTVLKTETLRIVLMAFRSGATLPNHHADGRISVQVLEGEIEFSTAQQTRRLRAGQIISVEAREPHHLSALNDAAVLLTIAWPSGKAATEQAQSEAHRTTGYA